MEERGSDISIDLTLDQLLLNDPVNPFIGMNVQSDSRLKRPLTSPPKLRTNPTNEINFR